MIDTYRIDILSDEVEYDFDPNESKEFYNKDWFNDNIHTIQVRKGKILNNNEEIFIVYIFSKIKKSYKKQGYNDKVKAYAIINDIAYRKGRLKTVPKEVKRAIEEYKRSE